MNDCDKSTCRGGPTGGIHRLPIRTYPVAEALSPERRGAPSALKKSEPGAAEESFTKSLTAKTTETRYRDPLRTSKPGVFLRENLGIRDRSKAVKRKSHKVLDGRRETD